MMQPPTSPNTIALSVVIPSYNRRGPLAVLLDALERQTLSPDRFEVIIVLDGGTDGSAAFLEQWAREHPPFPLRILSQANAGQSAARSRGAAESRGPVLLFLDDDIVPELRCLEAHARCHRDGTAKTVVLGDAWMSKSADESYYELITRMWWEDTYVERANRHPHSNYRDFCAGHVSMPRELFFEIGGFDSDFRGYGGEDYDLGYRLLRAGARFMLEPEARATHDHHGDPQQVFRNLLDEGRNDVRLGNKHPELRRGLRCAQPGTGARLIFLVPWLFHAALGLGSLLLRGLERGRLWHGWRWLLGKLRYLAYWLGVSRAFKDWAAYRQWIDAMPDRPLTPLDITDGLPTDLSSVWMHGPSTLVLTANGRECGSVDLEDIPRGSLAEWLADVITSQPFDAMSCCIASDAPGTCPPHRNDSNRQ